MLPQWKGKKQKINGKEIKIARRRRVREKRRKKKTNWMNKKQAQHRYYSGVRMAKGMNAK